MHWARVVAGHSLEVDGHLPQAAWPAIDVQGTPLIKACTLSLSIFSVVQNCGHWLGSLKLTSQVSVLHEFLNLFAWSTSILYPMTVAVRHSL